MAACPMCQNPISFGQMYRMLRKLIDTDRCRACDCVYALDTPTRIAHGASFVALLIASGCLVFVDQVFGIEVASDNRVYFLVALIVLSATIGILPIAWKAGVRGPVPIRTCPHCDYDLTGEGGLRCVNCGRMLPHSHRTFIHRLGAWMLPLVVVAGLLVLLFIEA